jgi:hypothetical protein
VNDERNILHQADEIIHGERAKAYGHPSENFKRAAAMMDAYLAGRDFTGELRDFFSEHDYAMFMVITKVARQADGYHRDSDLDICGYAALDAIVEGDDDYRIDE